MVRNIGEISALQLLFAWSNLRAHAVQLTRTGAGFMKPLHLTKAGLSN